MFEIVLMQDYEDIFFFREFEINGLNNQDKIGGSPVRGSSGRISPNKSNNSRSRSPHKGNLIVSPDGTRMIF